MKTPPVDVKSLNLINPTSIAEYLKRHEWEKVSDKNEASVWSFALKDGRVARVLLPNSNEPPDFSSRIYDIIRVISTVEERPETDVLLSIKSAARFAEDFARNVFNFRLTREKTSASGLPIKRLGTLLTSFQALVYAIAQYEEGIATESGPIANYILGSTTFSIVTTFKGSFGITLVNDLPEQGDQKGLLADLEGYEPLPERTIKSFMDLVESSTQEDSLKKNLVKIRKRAASGYRNFLLALSSTETDNVFEWGRPGHENSKAVQLSRLDVLKAVEIANKTVTEEPVEIDIEIAEWIGGNARREDFEIKDVSTEDTYFGKVASTAKVNAGNAIWHGLYSAKVLEEIELNESTQQISRKHTLLYLGPLTEKDQSERESPTNNYLEE
ncbi:MAG: hypothetical protein AAGH67_07690 [Cyanobacteria bacterium P01_H01_bin.162]